MTKFSATTVRLVAIAVLALVLSSHPLHADDPARVAKQLERMDYKFPPDGFLHVRASGARPSWFAKPQ